MITTFHKATDSLARMHCLAPKEAALVLENRLILGYFVDSRWLPSW